PVRPHAPCRVDAVPDDVDAAHERAGGIGMVMRRDCAVKGSGNGSRTARLSADEAESTDVDRRCGRIAPVDDDHGLALAPERLVPRRVLAAWHVRDTRRAFPPDLMSGAKIPYGRQEDGLAHVSYVPRLVPS